MSLKWFLQANSLSFFTLKVPIQMTNYIMIHFGSYLHIYGGFQSPKTKLLNEVMKIFFYLLLGVPFGLAWKFPFQLNLPKFIFPYLVVLDFFCKTIYFSSSALARFIEFQIFSECTYMRVELWFIPTVLSLICWNPWLGIPQHCSMLIVKVCSLIELQVQIYFIV